MKCNQLFALILIVLFHFSLYSCSSCENCLDPYQTSDITLYKDYPKLFTKEIAELTDRLFPDKIEDFFADPMYSFSLSKLDSASEVWLEFNIEDTEQYWTYKKTILLENEASPFKYDVTFDEWALEDTIYTGGDNEEYLELATMLKVLFHDETQTVIYIALLIEGPMIYHLPEEFIYFERFSIDITDYPRLYQDSKQS